jgi:hypothetical protein
LVPHSPVTISRLAKFDIRLKRVEAVDRRWLGTNLSLPVVALDQVAPASVPAADVEDRVADDQREDDGVEV